MVDRAVLTERLRRRLQTEAGEAGWGYYAGKAARIEPTCWALLALSTTWSPADGDADAFTRPHLTWLASLQSADGLLVETEPAFANLGANALAMIAFARLGSAAHTRTLTALQHGLASVKGVRLEPADGGQDNTLQAWPWVRDTFSWVEPTAWCLLALKLLPAAMRDRDWSARVDEAERLLNNRMCSGGGWNYGNASTLGQDLRPYVPTTAAGLLALQDAGTNPSVTASARRLVDLRTSERSTLALSLTALALRVHGLDPTDVEERLAEALPMSESHGHLQALALALLALSADTHNVEILRVRT